MSPAAPHTAAPVLRFDTLNWVASDCMQRDQEQSRRLHEPTHISFNIDPITGQDIGNLEGRPHLDNGNVTIYFENEVTCQAYLDTPFDHPFGKLPGQPSEEFDRGG